MISYLLSLLELGITVNVLFKLEDIVQSSIDYFRRRDGFLAMIGLITWTRVFFLELSDIEKLKVNTCYF